jgi:hypothetical protein
VFYDESAIRNPQPSFIAMIDTTLSECSRLLR